MHGSQYSLLLRDSSSATQSKPCKSAAWPPTGWPLCAGHLQQQARRGWDSHSLTRANLVNQPVLQVPAALSGMTQAFQRLIHPFSISVWGSRVLILTVPFSQSEHTHASSLAMKIQHTIYSMWSCQVCFFNWNNSLTFSTATFFSENKPFLSSDKQHIL